MPQRQRGCSPPPSQARTDGGGPRANPSPYQVQGSLAAAAPGPQNSRTIRGRRGAKLGAQGAAGEPNPRARQPPTAAPVAGAGAGLGLHGFRRDAVRGAARRRSPWRPNVRHDQRPGADEAPGGARAQTDDGGAANKRVRFSHLITSCSQLTWALLCHPSHPPCTRARVTGPMTIHDVIFGRALEERDHPGARSASISIHKREGSSHVGGEHRCVCVWCVCVCGVCATSYAQCKGFGGVTRPSKWASQG